MLATVSDILTAQFYRWEQRGRGHATFQVPVDLEPAFVPFFFHTTAALQRVVDDGKRPTFLSTVADAIRRVWQPRGMSHSHAPQEGHEALAYERSQEWPIVPLSFVLPKGFKVRPEEAEHLLLMLAACTHPLSFEIVATGAEIVVQLVCALPDVPYITGQVKTYFPLCALVQRDDALLSALEGDVHTIDFALAEEFMRPLATPSTFDPDPLLGLFGVLDHLAPGCAGAVQVLFQACKNPWAESVLRAVSTHGGDAFFADAPEMLPLARQKVSAPLYGVVVRTVGCGADETAAAITAQQIGIALARASSSAGNRLMPVSGEGCCPEDHLDDAVARRTRRLGMLLNSRELLTFVHLPSASVVSEKLQRERRKTKAAPPSAQGAAFTIGINEHEGTVAQVRIDSKQRLLHTHIIGATGTGKSTLIVHMALQDIASGGGCAVLDPHGDLIEAVLSYIPLHRARDVIIIDPADAEYPVGFNILSAHSEIEKDVLAADLVAAFRRLSSSWGDQMNSVFANAVLAFVESSKGGTLTDLRRFLVEKPFRDAFLKTVQDPSIVYYWIREYPLLKSSSIGSILTRLDSFLRPKLIRNMVAQQKSIDFARLMDERKIVLAKLSQGLIGAENSHLLGTFIVSKLHQAALARQARPQEARSDFFLYIDEFQHFITPSMSAILSGARKYHVGLTLAHQSLQQVQDSEVASAVIANAGTRICFRLGDADAKKLEDGFCSFTAHDLQNLGTGEAVARLNNPGQDFSLRTMQLLPATASAAIKEQVISYSRQQYSTPKHVVEAALAETMRMQAEPTDPKQGERQPINEAEAEAPTATPHPLQPAATTVEALAPGDAEAIIGQHHQRQHTLLKQKIKLMAESRGYRAILEAPTQDGSGFVDVSLERNGHRMAVEVSVSTSASWELHNVQKCLAAGYDTVIVCAVEKQVLERIRANVSQHLPLAQIKKVLVCNPEELFQYMNDAVLKDADDEPRIKGWKVKRVIKRLPPDAAAQASSSAQRIMSKPEAAQPEKKPTKRKG